MTVGLLAVDECLVDDVFARVCYQGLEGQGRNFRAGAEEELQGGARDGVGLSAIGRSVLDQG